MFINCYKKPYLKIKKFIFYLKKKNQIPLKLLKSNFYFFFSKKKIFKKKELKKSCSS